MTKNGEKPYIFDLTIAKIDRLDMLSERRTLSTEPFVLPAPKALSRLSIQPELPA